MSNFFNSSAGRQISLCCCCNCWMQNATGNYCFTCKWWLGVDDTTKIKCYFCRHVATGFESLAEHVKVCVGRPNYTPWRKALSMSYEQHKSKNGETTTMLPAAGQQQSNGGSSKRGGGVEWLKNSHLTLEPKRAKITNVRVADENDKYNHVVVKIALGGIPFLLGLKTTYGVYKSLLKEFGDDENNWVAKDILLYVEVDEMTEKRFMKVSFPPAATTTATRRMTATREA